LNAFSMWDWARLPRMISSVVQLKGNKGDVGREIRGTLVQREITCYLSHASNSIISSSLPIRFTDDVVIPRNLATDAPVYPNFRNAT